MEKFPELKVMVYAEGRLSVFLPQQPFEVQAGITVLEVASLIGMPDNIPFAATVNQRVVDLNDYLNPGDEVHLFPQISGGKE